MTSAPQRSALSLLAALAAAALTLVPSPPAGAGPSIPAGCGDVDLADPAAVVAAADGSDDVFVGRVVRIEANRVGHEVVVEDAVAGDLRPGQPARVVLAGDRGDDVRLRLNATYVFFTSGEDRALQADSCDGWVSARGLTASGVAELREALSPPEPPSVTFSEPEGGSDGAPELGRVLAPGGAIALVGVLGLVLLSRVGRPRP
ncbi:MAG TPA: hypothetical protein VNT31_09595 [Nocardioides sp.]|nr:hypothetical protein [Nocardioides sp.]